MASSSEPPSDLDSHEFSTQIIYPQEEVLGYEYPTRHWAAVITKVLAFILLMCVCLTGVASLAYGVMLFTDSSEEQAALSLWQEGLATQTALNAKQTATAEAVEKLNTATFTPSSPPPTSTSTPHAVDNKDRAQTIGTTDSVPPEDHPGDIDAAIAFHSYEASSGWAIFRVTNMSDGATLESATTRIKNRDTNVHYYGPLHSSSPFWPDPTSGAPESSLSPGATKYMRYRLGSNLSGAPCQATIALHTTEGGSGSNVTKVLDFDIEEQATDKPMVMVQPNQLKISPCAPIPGETYPQTRVNPPSTNRPAESHPDLNLSMRGYVPANARKKLVFYDGDTDKNAVQLSGLLGRGSRAVISSVYRVYDWDWTGHRRGRLINDPEVTLMGLAVTPGDIIRLPGSGRTIGEGFQALVLYADSSRLTIKYTREDTVTGGYTVHLGNICPEPRLLALYQNCNAGGRVRLPALRAGHALGRATGSELLVAIRDNGDFMDPRSSKDWWSK